ncbi:hypothetical protein BBD41_26580 [Paenibacillus ihbetae]|uniref:Uncharacterized protein n=1 Tax=Paenibacillus ihbetae TaxID=1870820 RepID=A0A1B2E788_9BACL|nr:hypothetical protein BBD41_26580 [Paenibacillus ihbetae]OOC61976.1 hypothetical protein BBD40_08985 [Paenibacillus ihbetae]
MENYIEPRTAILQWRVRGFFVLIQQRNRTLLVRVTVSNKGRGLEFVHCLDKSRKGNCPGQKKLPEAEQVPERDLCGQKEL